MKLLGRELKVLEFFRFKYHSHYFTFKILGEELQLLGFYVFIVTVITLWC
jgi:hypothetical protein